jgi:hypothetical protein
MKIFGYLFSMMAFAIICVVLTGIATAQVFDSGPLNGTVDAWNISFGDSVSDSFLLKSSTQLTAIQFWVWEFPGDQLTSVDRQISAGGGIGCGSVIVICFPHSCYWRPRQLTK